MKKNTTRTTAILVAAVMLASLIAGCNNRESDGENETTIGGSEYVYVPEYISLPEDLMDISNLNVIGDRLVFSSTSYDEETRESITKLFTMAFDGTELSEMENYAYDEKPEGSPENTMGSAYITTMFPDGDGNIWIGERCSYYYYDLPEDLSDEDLELYGPYAYYQSLGEYTILRQLDMTGKELKRVELDAISEQRDYFYLGSASIDSDGYIYVAFQETIYVLDDSGKILFEISDLEWANQLIAMPDGSVAHYGWNNEGRILQKIDSKNKNWGEMVEIPYNISTIYPGGGAYDLVFSDYSNLYGIESETGETVTLLNWINSDIGSDSAINVAMLPDEGILLTSYIYDYSNPGAGRFEITILSKVPADSVPPRTVLTLACHGVDYYLRNAIVSYNKTNTKYRIHVVDYSVYDTEDDYYAGRTRLSTEIISGNVPDLILTAGLPFNQYVAKGLIEDLYPFIDADPEYNRAAVVESALRACEIDGSLYQVFQTFSILSMWGRASVLGSDSGWTMDEFMEVIDANPQAIYPVGYYVSKNDFLRQSVMINIDKYVDWVKGEVYFDTEGFVRLLEFANTMPDQVEYDFDNYISEEELIANGEQIMRMGVVYDFRNPLLEITRFGDDLVYKGFPSDSKAGNTISIQGSMAMTTSCKDKEGAWDFMRLILSEDTSSRSMMMRFGFPINKAAFDGMLEEIMTQEYEIDEDGNEVPLPKMGYYPQSGGYTTFSSGLGIGYSVTSSAMSVSSPGRRFGGMSGEDEMIYIYAMTQEQADQIMKLFDSVSGVIGGYDESLYSIITEGTENYFNGRGTAEEAARIIQGKAAIYISEQS